MMTGFKVSLAWLGIFASIGLAGAISEFISPVMPEIGPQPLEVFGGSIIMGLICIVPIAIFIGILGGIDSRMINKEYHDFTWDWTDSVPSSSVSEPTRFKRIGPMGMRIVNPNDSFESAGPCNCSGARKRADGLSPQILVEIGSRNTWKCIWCGKKH